MSTVEDLGNEIAALSVQLDAAAQKLLACIRAFDEAGGWEKQGAVSCAHWLSWRVGLDLATAREKVRVARALGPLTFIDEALARGEISYAKARAMTRVATVANQERLLDLARSATGAQLERICRGYRHVAASLTDGGALPEERSVRERLLPGGMVKLELVLHPDEAALVRAALEKARESLRGETRTDLQAKQPSATDRDTGPLTDKMEVVFAEPGQTHPALHVSAEESAESLADAAVLMAQAFLDDRRGVAAGAGSENHQIFVHLDEDALGAEGTWVATLDDGTRLPSETLRRLACDTGLVATRTDHSGTVLDVGRRTRSIPRRFAEPSGYGTGAVVFQAAATTGSCTGTTSSTGSTAAPPASTIWCCSVPVTTG